jgi:drug/metabolite transporter (DMT)-like permease
VPAATAAVVVMWASAFVAIRGIGNSLSPGPLALVRLSVGSAALGVMAVRMRRPVPRGRSIGLVVAYGVSWFAGYTFVLNAAERHLDAGTAAMLVNFGPIIVAVLAGLFMGEGFPRRLVIGIIIGFAGVACIALGGSGRHTDGLGIALGLVSAFLYGGSVLLQKLALRSIDAVSATWIGCVAGTVALLGFLPQTVHELSHASATAVLGGIYLGLFPTALAFTFWAYALTHSDAGRLASTTLTVPAIAVAMSWALLSEVPTAFAMIGGALCLAGVAVTRLRSKAAAVDVPAHAGVPSESRASCANLVAPTDS